tara:strand:- start:17101 stop:17670 length:570 start_codon:yes stop_codon:yes gene_type:complete
MPKEINFKDYPDFTPNLTPEEIYRLGSFGGTYWRPIKSNITGKKYENQHKEFPDSWWKGLPDNWLVTEWNKYDKKINKYGVKVGTTLRFWEKKNWITKLDPYGWVQWYCRFYQGRRNKDEDERQIKRWKGVASENGRFRKRLIGLIIKKDTSWDDITISPKIRQTLQHWGYQLTKKDFDKEKVKREKNN